MEAGGAPGRPQASLEPERRHRVEEEAVLWTGRAVPGGRSHIRKRLQVCIYGIRLRQAWLECE